MKIREKFKERDRNLFCNTMMLYVFMFSSQFLNLATIPYLTRVLGAVVFGKVGLALSYMAYVQIILDFGFILSATQRVAENREDKVYLGKIFTSVTILKLFLSVVVSVIFVGYILLNQSMRGDWPFYLLYLIVYIINALMPDFFYRGMENMKIITYRTIAVKAFFTAMVFIFIHDKSQYMLLPAFSLVGNLATVGIMYADIKNRYDVRLCYVDRETILKHLMNSAQFFSSRISSTAYQAANTIILSFIYGNSAVIGYYSSADKLVSFSKSASSPVADSLFPYMIKNKNFKMVKIILYIYMPFIVAAVVICGIFAEQICVILFGSEYREAGNILRLLLPVILVIFPTYILAFPVMVPMGLTKLANFSNIFGLCVQVILILCFMIFGNLTIYTLCISTSITEVSVFLFRLITILRHRDRLKILVDSL